MTSPRDSPGRADPRPAPNPADVSALVPSASSGTQLVAACRVHPTPMAVLQGPEGVLLLNAACVRLLAHRSPQVAGRPWGAAWPELHAALRGSHLAGPVEGLVEIATPSGLRRFRCRSAPIPPGDAALLVFEALDSPPASPEPTSAPRTGVTSSADPADLADLASLDVGTICAALGRLVVPALAPRAIVWQRTTDRMGRGRLERRDVPARSRRRAAGSSALADRLGVERVLLTGVSVDRRLRPDDIWPAVRAVTVPLRDKRRVVAALTLEEPPDRPLDQAALGHLQDLADRAGVALANASRFRIEHSISRDLQRLLAPRALPSVRGVDMAAQLIAGSPGVTVGGDWYDACETPDGRLAVTIGDVVGHGLRPAIEMTQLRTGLRNLAMEGLDPTDVLAGADAFLRRTGEARFVTCIHAVYRPDTGQLDMANSGHLAPVLLPVDGRPRPVPMGPGLPLGGAADLARDVDRVPIGTCRVVLQPGDSVLMFTDGLVESPTRTADRGVAQLVALLETIGPGRRAAAGHPRRRRRVVRSGPSARELCTRVLSELDQGGEGDRDDVALLVLRRRRQRR